MYIPSIGTLKDFKQGYDLGCDLQQSLWGCGVVLEWNGAGGQSGSRETREGLVQLPRLDGSCLASGVTEGLDSRDILEVGWVGFDKEDKICVLTLEI